MKQELEQLAEIQIHSEMCFFQHNAAECKFNIDTNHTNINTYKIKKNHTKKHINTNTIILLTTVNAGFPGAT